MRRKLAALVMLTMTAAMFVGIRSASAHQCPDGYEPNDPECQDTAVYDDWRPNYVPAFDLADRNDEDGDGEEQRRDAQRWRDECRNGNQFRQQCAWVYGGQSAKPYGPSDPPGSTPRPNELHIGYSATHCFLAEGAHDCDSHDETEFGTHDSHGGAIYADICLATNPDSKFCDDGLKDTQVGVTIVDHLTCPMGCFDEYHVVRPLDQEYTQRQMDNSVTATQNALSDPQRHICGYEDKGSNC